MAMQRQWTIASAPPAQPITVTVNDLYQRQAFLMVYSCVLPIALSNILRSALVCHRRRRELIHWLNLVQSICLAAGTLFMIRHYAVTPTTYNDCFPSIVGFRAHYLISMTCIHAIMLLKALLCTNGGNRYMLAASLLSESVFIGYFLYNTVQLHVLQEEWGGCIAFDTSYALIVRAIMNMLPNTFFSIYLIHALYCYRQRLREKVAMHLLTSRMALNDTLMVDTLIYLFTMTVAAIMVCMVIVIGLKMKGVLTFLFSLDWLVASTLMSRQMQRFDSYAYRITDTADHHAKDKANRATRLCLPTCR